jgi:carbon-monoxide dehydrogenase medium subunit
VGVASVISLDARGKVADVRVGVTGVASVPYRARKVEERLRGRAPAARDIAEASAAAAEDVDPPSDLHASAAYRKEMAAIFTRRSLEKAVQRAGKQSTVHT